MPQHHAHELTRKQWVTASYGTAGDVDTLQGGRPVAIQFRVNGCPGLVGLVEQICFIPDANVNIGKIVNSIGQIPVGSRTMETARGFLAGLVSTLGKVTTAEETPHGNVTSIHLVFRFPPEVFNEIRMSEYGPKLQEWIGEGEVETAEFTPVVREPKVEPAQEQESQP